MTGPHRLFAVVEQGNPFRIPDPPAPAYRFVELVDATWTYAVYQGDPPHTTLLGYVRNCPEKCAWIARTTGSSSAPADVRQWPSREPAAKWLSRAVNGVMPHADADRRRRKGHTRVAVVGLALIALAGCASTPTGPTVQVMPAPNKSLAVFSDDNMICKHYAAGEVEGEASHSDWMQVAIGAGGTLLGAGLGAAIGGGHGAAIGAGAGALGGSAVGLVPSSKAQKTTQDRYDIAYVQCMATRGNQVDGTVARTVSDRRSRGAL